MTSQDNSPPLTPAAVRAEPAGRRLDSWVAVSLGWRWCPTNISLPRRRFYLAPPEDVLKFLPHLPRTDEEGIIQLTMPHFSSDLNAAAEAFAATPEPTTKIKRKWFRTVIQRKDGTWEAGWTTANKNGHGRPWLARATATADTMPLALCRAALLARLASGTRGTR